MAMRKKAGMNQGRVSCLTLKSRRHTLHAMSFCSRQDAVLPCIGPGKRCKRHWRGRRLRHPERSAMIHGPPNVTCVAHNHDLHNGKCQHSMHLAQQSGAQRQMASSGSTGGQAAMSNMSPHGRSGAGTRGGELFAARRADTVVGLHWGMQCRPALTRCGSGTDSPNA